MRWTCVIQAHLLNTLNMMSKLFPLDWFEVQRFLKKSHVSSKIDLEISDKRVTFQGIFELQIQDRGKPRDF